MNFTIPSIATHLKNEIQNKLDNKAKPVGSLGKLEQMALKIACIQHTLTPKLTKPVMLTVAADHGITAEGVSPCPTEITWQQVNNFLIGGGGIGLFCKLYDIDHWVADAGVNFDFKPHPKLIDVKIKKGTANFAQAPAMTMEECNQAIENGRKIVRNFHKNGSNIIGFGEMGIGNTTPASALLSIFANKPVSKCVGPGSGLQPEGVLHKQNIIEKALKKHGVSKNPIENLARFGGFEIATITGAMLEAAAKQMVIITDGFITTSALLTAHAINPKVIEYAFFSHQSKEIGHKLMMDFLHGEPILDLDLRLGEGTGAALAYPILKGAVAVLSEMTSFEQSQVTNTTHIRI